MSGTRARDRDHGSAGGRHQSRTRQPTGVRRRSVGDLLRGLLSLLTILMLLVGIPAALIVVRGNPLPGIGLNLHALASALTRPDDGSLFLGAVAWIGWLAWASFALSIAVETVAQLRGLPSPHLPALGPQQRAASALIATIALLYTVPLLTAAPARGAEPTSHSPIPRPASTISAPHVVLPLATPTAATTVAAAPEPRLPVYTVQAGDSLWQIAAEHLGDGARYPEIAALNYHRTQPDGHTLTADHWLRPGWQLLLPATANRLPPATVSPNDGHPHTTNVAHLPQTTSDTETVTVTVAPGDTLWEVADDALGDGARYPEIAAASHGVQADGGHLTDPDLIQPGWELTVPHSTLHAHPPTPPHHQPPPAEPDHATHTSTRSAPAGETTTRQPHCPADPTGDAPAPSTTSGHQPGSQPGSQEGNASDRPGQESQDPVTVRTATGVGALLAAGMLVLLGRKRSRQQCRRRPGQRIAMPPPELAAAELALRHTEDPVGLGRVDQALRTLSLMLGMTGRVLPGLRLIRLAGEDLELYLSEPGLPPAPFTGAADATVWTLASDAALPTSEQLAGVGAPYPSLVTLGHDLDGAHLLIDLEHATHLSLNSPRHGHGHGENDGDGDGGGSDGENGLAVLAALTAELATSPWADDLQITAVGCLPDLPAALGTGRVQHLPSLEQLLPALEHRVAAVRAALAAAGLQDLRHARTHGSPGQQHGDAWTPHIVVLAGPVRPDLRHRLAGIAHDLPAAGVALVTVAGSDSGVDSGFGQRTEWTLTLESPEAGQDPLAVLDPLGITLHPQHLNRQDLQKLLALISITDLPAHSLPDHEPGPGPLIADEPTLADLGRGLQDGTAATSHVPCGTPAVDEAEPAANSNAGPDRAAETAASSAVMPAPMVRLLGSVDLIGARGEVEQSKQRQLTEIAAYLTLNPGRDHSHLNEAIWPGARSLDNTRNTAVSKLRKWLGSSPDGRDYVPSVLSDGYRLHPDVTSDWQQWLALLPAGSSTASTHDLAAALELVHGKPFAGTNPRRYAWAERDRQDMISAIVDVAHELARRALLEADATLARRAAAAGLQADPGAELLWRDTLKAEWLAGDLDSVRHTAERLTALAEELGDDLEPETIALLEQLLGQPIRNADLR
jgi:LysM repeat protein/DNA-binding SARP family transcriptional activator